MKIARYVSIGMLGLFVVTIRASADPSDDVPEVNPYTQYDPDGVPLAVTQPHPKPLTQDQINEIRKEEQKAAFDKNWLLRNYEQQLQARAAKSPEDQSTNLYYQLSSNKELAKLAGLPALDSDSQEGAPPNRTGVAPSGQNSSVLRPDASAAVKRGSPSLGHGFKPLITPLSAPDAAGLHNFYSSLPLLMASPISGSLPQTPRSPQAAQSRDISDIETPGMVSAGKNPPTDTNIPDLTLDILPGESIEQARAHQDSNNSLELPLAMDADQLHKEQAAALSVPTVPGVPKTTQTAKPAPAPVKTVPINDEDAPMPVSKSIQINPVRAPIAKPYDILNR